MKRIALNHDWLFARGTITMMELFTGSREKIQKIDLPHDAMIHRERTPDTANAHQTGFYPGGEYTYLKQWEVPSEWAGKTVALNLRAWRIPAGFMSTGILWRNIIIPIRDSLRMCLPF